MAEGRWLDDAYSGAERPQALGSRFLPAFYHYLTWTWPVPLVGMLFLPAAWGWLAAWGTWLLLSYPLYARDVRRFNAAVAAYERSRHTPNKQRGRQ